MEWLNSGCWMPRGKAIFLPFPLPVDQDSVGNFFRSNQPMKIHFCGAAGTTTGSQHLLEVNGLRILLDCGLFQGHRKESYEKNRHFPYYDPASVDALILSHAHIDHSGNIPNLVKQGFDGNIYCTFATRDLCQIMLADSARIQQADADYLNRKRKHTKLPPIAPLYEPLDAERCMRNFVNVGYDRSLPVGEGVTMTLVDAGHILGAAQVILDIVDKDDGKRKRLLFSGDVGRGNNDLLNDPVAVPDVDLMIMESTYGGVTHEASASSSKRLQHILNEALQTGGKIIIPAFAVERTQQLLFALHQMLEKDEIPDVPVYVDSPLAVNATEVFRLHPECFNHKVYNMLFEPSNPFGFEGLTLIRTVRGSQELNDKKGAGIIISASGMCEAGRVLHHLKNHIGDPATTVLFVGHCAENTLGRRIRDGVSPVNILGKSYKVRAKVEAVDSLSGHADHNELLRYFEATGGSKSTVWLVHGEAERSHALAQALRPLAGDRTVLAAELGEVALA